MRPTDRGSGRVLGSTGGRPTALTRTADRSVSSGGSSATAVAPAGGWQGRAGQICHCARGRRRSTRRDALRPAQVMQVKQRCFRLRVARDLRHVLDRHAALRERGHIGLGQIRGGDDRAPDISAQTWVRCVLPAPSGPVSTSLPPAQFCQSSIIASAMALDGRQKTHRAPAPCGWADRNQVAEACQSGSCPRRTGTHVKQALLILIDCESGQSRRWPPPGHGDQHADKAERAYQRPTGRAVNQTGCSPTELPTSLGVRMLPSITLPRPKIPATSPMETQSPQN